MVGEIVVKRCSVMGTAPKSARRPAMAAACRGGRITPAVPLSESARPLSERSLAFRDFIWPNMDKSTGTVVSIALQHSKAESFRAFHTAPRVDRRCAAP